MVLFLSFCLSKKLFYLNKIVSGKKSLFNKIITVLTLELNDIVIKKGNTVRKICLLQYIDIAL